MTPEDELRQLFESADTAVDLEPGSLSSVKGRAAQRTRTSQRLTSGAVGLAVLAVGVAGWLAFAPIQESIEVTTDGTTESEDLNENNDGEPEEEEGEPQPEDSVVEDESIVEDSIGEEDLVASEDGLVTEDDFAYLGAYLAPAGEVGDSQFAFGGAVSAFNPSGDPDDTDSFTGSLFMSGHPQDNPGVAELTIPEPAAHRGSTEGLPVAEVLQPFADITDGRAFEFVGSESVGGDGEYRYGGLEVVDGPTGSRLHWSIWQYNNVTDSDIPGHGHSSLDLGQPDPQGPWFLGEANNLVTAGYLLTVPNDFADQHFGGRQLITGHKDEATSSTRSWGPPFFAYSPPDTGEPNSRVDALELASYLDGDQLADYGRADVAPGAAWVTTSDGLSAVVTVGRRGLGEVREGLPNEGDCSQYAGIHADPYEPQIMFYRPDDLAAVASGEMEPAALEPYRSWNPAEHLIPRCDWFLSSISFDVENNVAYIVQIEADTSQEEFSPVPVIHVFQL